MEERNYYKNERNERKVQIKKKGKAHIMDLSDKREGDIKISGSKRRSFSK